jgi:hypothetical protein
VWQLISFPNDDIIFGKIESLKAPKERSTGEKHVDFKKAILLVAFIIVFLYIRSCVPLRWEHSPVTAG